MSEFVNQHRTFQQVLCLLICVCAWRGPVPVLHDHDAVKNSELQTRHAQAFHDGQQIQSIVGLHWHMGFPEDVTGEECPARDEATAELPLFACASAANSDQITAATSLQLEFNALNAPQFILVEIDASLRSRSAGQPRAFLQTLLSELPLSAVTGVCLV